MSITGGIEYCLVLHTELPYIAFQSLLGNQSEPNGFSVNSNSVTVYVVYVQSGAGTRHLVSVCTVWGWDTAF